MPEEKKKSNIRNVNARGVEKAYCVSDKDFLPDDWEEMRVVPNP